jgi:drug/metabolite transporter (DMT)-like permease
MIGPAVLSEKFPAAVSMRSELAFAYLVLFGSIVGFSSFIYSLTHLPVAVVSIYTFVNPVVAVFLGWLFFREPFGWPGAIAMSVIFAGIALVRWSENSRRSTASAPVVEEIGALGE